MRNIENNLHQKLRAYGDSDYYPFHMPGHKRNSAFLPFENPFKIDITEIEGFDNLHHAEGIIKEAQSRASELYKSEETHFLVNGSSVGILSAIFGCLKRGEKILMARNCHKAVYHAAELLGLWPVYIYPHIHEKYGIYEGIDAAGVRAMLEKYPDIKAVIITSPTYEGIVSDIKAVAKVAHDFSLPLIVDEAHGAHFGFHEYFPAGALSGGADIVIQSVHKTLPSLTQTALLHMQGSLVKREAVRKYLAYFQTSSPSYLFMASIDHCIHLIKEKGSSLFEIYAKRLEKFYEKARAFKNLELLNKEMLTDGRYFDFDRSKLVVFSKPVSACGNGLYDLLLNKYHLQMEMASRDFVLGMTSFCDTEEGFERFFCALSEIDSGIELGDNKYSISKQIFEAENTEPVLDIASAVLAESETVGFWESEGCISKEYAYIYPPGVPFLAPGEKITKGHLLKINSFAEAGFCIEGISDIELKTMKIVKV